MRTTHVIVTAAAAALLATACSSGVSSQGSSSGGSGSAPLAAAVAQGAAGDAGLPPGVSVVGEGRVEGKPDTLRATLGVEVARDTVQESLDVANERVQAVIDAVTGLGVDEKDIQTREFSVYPRYSDQPTQNQPEIVGYNVSNLIEVKIGDLERVGELLTAAVEAGGEEARVQGIGFSLEDNAALLEQARQAAFEDARTKAEQYAQLAGTELGGLVTVSETVASMPQAQEFALEQAFDSAAGASRAVPIQAGQQEVSVRITAVWSFG